MTLLLRRLDSRGLAEAKDRLQLAGSALLTLRGFMRDCIGVAQGQQTPMTLEAALSAMAATVVKAYDALDNHPAALADQLVAIGNLVGEAMAAVVRSRGERAMQAGVAQNLTTIMAAVRDTLRLLRDGAEMDAVASSVGAINAAVTHARDTYTPHRLVK
jgi:hypothetical protein